MLLWICAPSRSVVKVKCKIDIRNDETLLIFIVTLLQNTIIEYLSVCVCVAVFMLCVCFCNIGLTIK